jgi:hypothetical protein
MGVLKSAHNWDPKRIQLVLIGTDNRTFWTFFAGHTKDLVLPA